MCTESYVHVTLQGSSELGCIIFASPIGMKSQHANNLNKIETKGLGERKKTTSKDAESPQGETYRRCWSARSPLCYNGARDCFNPTVHFFRAISLKEIKGISQWNFSPNHLLFPYIPYRGNKMSPANTFKDNNFFKKFSEHFCLFLIIYFCFVFQDHSGG